MQAISIITENDHALYRNFFSQVNHRACYGNSWTYITQACRKFGYGKKYYVEGSLISIGKHNGHYVIVRPLGMIDNRFIQLLDYLHQESGKPVFIKKLFPEQVIHLQKYARFAEASIYDPVMDIAYAGIYIWDEIAFADDDTYPELILDLDITLKYMLPIHEWFKIYCKGRLLTARIEYLKRIKRKYGEFRRRLRQFSQSGIEPCWRKYNTNMAEDVRRFLLNYFSSSRAENLQAYENLLLSSSTDTFGWVVTVNGNSFPVGFFFAERIDDKSAGLYASIISRSYPGLAEYLWAEMMSHLVKEGLSFLNVGGSETRNLQIYKQQFAPVEERVMRTLVYGLE
jgi:hypothetical protein